ncbi:glycoside hydrolase family 43 protein [Kallotenue papyrolyticum]|uniref:glycoside hydrolase family 43 protein n=1 Tax=Kallotenue papyrolyticum TaxID=1325125 RepID=UPI0009DDF7EF|nr:glycoside hydrolase family 43 protein [Kallotenue papyrolyticum]
MQRALRVTLCCWLLLVACGSDQPTARRESSPAPSVATQALGQTATASTVSPSPTRQPATATTPPSPTRAPTATPTPGPNEFYNPVIDRDFPDPDTVRVGETYYAYATNSGGYNIQTARSSDLVNWQLLSDALPSLPAWASSGFTWAPEVTSWDGGEHFMMYFTARHTESGRQCIGAAMADDPEAAFVPVGEEPLICQLDQGGSIDAATFVDDDGARYLLWKNDGNCCGHLTYIYLQKVAADGLTLEGEPVPLITNDQYWEGGLVEAPTLWKHDGRYYLFYSANSYSGSAYAIGYAVADRVLGPYTKPASDPLLSTDFQAGAAIGPGGQDIAVDDADQTWLVYHSWNPTVAYRRMMIDELLWEDARPVVKGPDIGPQPKPVDQ